MIASTDSAWTRALLLLAAFAVALGLERGGLLQGVDDSLSELRMALTPRAASGDIALLAIDKRSIDAIDVLPWPRSVHAEIVRRLVESGVREIVFDIDFSSPSTPEADQDLAQAIAASPAVIILPALLQSASPDRRDGALASNRPIRAFSERAWIATANVRPDRDGTIRRFSFGETVDGEDLPSIPALLSGRLGATGAEFRIDFSIAPDTVPTYSVTDLLERRISPDALAGRSIVVGAHAIELRDYYNVPVHGFISGAMIQILAAETLAQDRVLKPLAPLSLALALGAVLGAFLHLSRLGLRGRLLGILAVAVLVELAALWLQTRYALVAPTAELHTILAVVAIGLASQELDVQKWLLRVLETENRNIQQILQHVFRDSFDAVIVADEDGRILHASRQAAAMFGLRGGTDPELHGRNLRDASLDGLAEAVGSSAKALSKGR